jgi:hypothetical protein
VSARAASLVNEADHDLAILFMRVIQMKTDVLAGLQRYL